MRIDSCAPIAPSARARRGSERRPRLHIVAALIELADGHAELLRHSERAWASVTFTGARHTLCLAFVGEAAIAAGEAFIAALPEHEFAIPGQLVADAVVLAVDHTLIPEPRMTVDIELLLLEEC